MHNSKNYIKNQWGQVKKAASNDKSLEIWKFMFSTAMKELMDRSALHNSRGNNALAKFSP